MLNTPEKQTWVIHIPTQTEFEVRLRSKHKETGAITLAGCGCHNPDCTHPPSKFPLEECEATSNPKDRPKTLQVGCKVTWDMPTTLSYIAGWGPLLVERIEGNHAKIELVEQLVPTNELKVVEAAKPQPYSGGFEPGDRVRFNSDGKPGTVTHIRPYPAIVDPKAIISVRPGLDGPERYYRADEITLEEKAEIFTVTAKKTKEKVSELT